MKTLYIPDNSIYTCEQIFISGDESKKNVSKYHWHASIELIYLTRGSIRLTLGKHTYDLNCGDVAVIRSCEQHGYSLNYNERCANIVSIRFETSLIKNYNNLKCENSFIVRCDTLENHGDSKTISVLSQGISDRVMSNVQNAEQLISSYISALFATVMSHFDKGRTNDTGTLLSSDFQRVFSDFSDDEPDTGISPHTMNHFHELIEYIDSHFTDSSLSLHTLSAISGLSVSYISELFPQVISIKFKTYLNTLRINHALFLLSNKNMTISQIAYECGFDTIRTFNSVFKKLKYVTPSEYISEKSGTDSGITTSFENLCASGLSKVPPSVYGLNGSVSIAKSPTDKDKNVFLVDTDVTNKAWVSFNVHMRFKAGAKYRVSFDVYPLKDACGDAFSHGWIGINMFYTQSGDNHSEHHAFTGISCDSDSGWHHVEGDVFVLDSYVPTLYDKFQIFAHPQNNVGTKFMVDNITCKLTVE